MIEIDRAVFEFRYPEDAKRITEKGWEQAGQKIRLPDDMPFDTAAVIMSVLPKVLQFARTDVMAVLALVVMRDDDLRAADEAGDVEEKVQEQAKKLLYDGTLEELADLGAAAFAQVQELNSGKVKALFGQVSSLLNPEEQFEDDPIPVEEMNLEDSNETSSTSSPESTDGPENKPSGSDSMTSPPTPVG